MLPQLHPHPLHLHIPKYIPLHTNSKLQQHIISATDDDDDDDNDNIHSPPSDFQYTDSFHSASDIYHNQSPYPAQYSSSSASNAETGAYIINNTPGLRDSDAVPQYLSDSPSPVDLHPPNSLSHPSGAPRSQDRFPHSPQPQYPEIDRTSAHFVLDSERYSRTNNPQMVKYQPSAIQIQNSLLDQRRMSEPAVLTTNTLYHSNDINSAPRHHQFQFAFNPPSLSASRSPSSNYLSPLHRGASTGSLRDLRHQHFHYPPPSLTHQWKQETQPQDLEYYDRSGGLDTPISPFQPNFTGGLVSPTSGMPYSPNSENLYGPSPPGTGTSTSSSGPLSAGLSGPTPHHFPQYAHHQRSVSGTSSSGDAADRKNYAFIALPGNTVKKRPRRRYDEIERLYQCSWPDCTKSYGTLNHLNAHVTMQKHGSKRSPNEFKELRKQWRKAKKESEGQTPAPIRRSSFSARHEEFDYDIKPRYGMVQSPHQRPHHTFHHSDDFSSSISIPPERYPVAIEDIRFPLHDRDDHLSSHGSMSARQRYSSHLPASWHGGSPLASRNLPQAYISSSLPNHHEHQHAHHSHLPQLAITSSSLHPHSVPVPPSPSRVAMNRLPPDSTLLTPLPGYQTQAMMSVTADTNIGYGSDIYEAYENDNNSRPGTGHASLGPGSSDEYDHRS